MSIRKNFVCLLLLGACALGSAHADEVMVTANDSRPPKMYLDQAGQPRGILIDILRYLERETGHKFIVDLKPFARALRDASKGMEGIMSFSKTAERLEIFDFGEEVMFWDELVLVVKKGNEFPFETLNDLRGKRLGIPQSGAFGDAFDRAVKDGLFTVDGGSHPAYQLGMLASGRLDAVLVSFGKAGLNAIQESPEYAATMKSPTQFVVLPTPLARDPNYLAFAKSMKRRALLNDVDKALRKGYQNGAIPAIISGYSSRSRSP